MTQETQTTLTGIILYPHEVRAILDGHQTEIRRPLKPQPKPCDHSAYQEAPWKNEPTVFVEINDFPGEWYCKYCGNGIHQTGRYNWPGIKCPYGRVGDRLWAKETWDGDHNRVSYKASMMSYGICDTFNWTTCESEYDAKIFPSRIPQYQTVKWRPSSNMPQWASRITLEIMGIRVERVQEITEEGAKASGARPGHILCSPTILHKGQPGYTETPQDYRGGFRRYWDDDNAKRGFGWDTNSWVWVITFKMVKP